MSCRHHADDRSWQLRARCRGLPTEIFFASDAERGQRRAVREERAKEVCRRCPVQRDCLRYALTHVEPWGIWGATTPRERQRLGVSRSG
ncbi:WhiB family transcriptional regulator [Mycolicibacterium celeriflavum]|uniref:WhiB family transcriptional regulator n=1 Tax=Mycolicibacterium celeriflavum TaxID=1249101 RepID=UPI0009ECE38E|nr:WhiB family transcriptional regulator [Mycolicibacterium celeriflavum]